MDHTLDLHPYRKSVCLSYQKQLEAQLLFSSNYSISLIPHNDFCKDHLHFFSLSLDDDLLIIQFLQVVKHQHQNNVD